MAQRKNLHAVVAAALLVACHSNAQEAEQRLSPPPAVIAPVAAPADARASADTRLDFIPQTDNSDCGPAAVAITLNHYGHPTTLDAIKIAMHYQSEAMSALDLVKVAEANGLGVVGISASADVLLPHLKTGDILHFDFNHFVVFEALVTGGVWIVDPGIGRTLLDRSVFAQRFTGVALLFESSREAIAARERSIGLSSDPE